ncbi:hypothetical protein KI387_036193, partial [Taxus chinensis]
DNEEFDCLSDLEECFDEEEPVEITTFVASSFTLQSQELATKKENVQEGFVVWNMPLES